MHKKMGGLRDVPELLVGVIEKKIWRERVVNATGELVCFERFEDFVTTPPLEGLGSEIRQLKHLCRDDKEALDAIDRATSGRHGGDHTSDQSKANNVKLAPAPEGNSNTYALRKLRKDRPDLHQQVIAEEKSPHAAMVEAGFRRKTITIAVDLETAAKQLTGRPSGELRASFAGVGQSEGSEPCGGELQPHDRSRCAEHE